MSNKVDLELLKKEKQEAQLLDIMNAAKAMKPFYLSMKEEGFTDEFIAIYLAHMTKK